MNNLFLPLGGRDSFDWSICHNCGLRWCRGLIGTLQPEGCGFESTSSRRVGTLGKSFARNCSCSSAWNSDSVSALYSRERLWVEILKGRYINIRNEWWMNEWISWRNRQYLFNSAIKLFSANIALPSLFLNRAYSTTISVSRLTRFLTCKIFECPRNSLYIEPRTSGYHQEVHDWDDESCLEGGGSLTRPR